MPPITYSRATERFRAFGIDLNNPPDNVRPGYFPLLENVRSYTDGIIQPRQGLSGGAAVLVNKTPVHSLRHLNDPNTAAPNNFIRVVGANDALVWYDPATTTYTQATYNGGPESFSTNPLILVPYRPDQSISSWMYIADSQLMRKIIGYNSQGIAKGTVHRIGIDPPLTAAVVELAAPLQAVTSWDFATSPIPGAWTTIGTSAGPTSVVRIDITTVTITKALYDSGSTGWACMVPANPANISRGMLLSFDNGIITESNVVFEVYPGTGSVAGGVVNITYDNSPTNTGTCTIVAKGSLNEICRNAVVLLNGATYVRVTHSAHGPNNNVSFRCTTGATTIAPSASLQVVPSFRVFSNSGMTTGNKIGINVISLTTNAVTSVLINNTAFDLSRAGPSPLSDEDYFNLSLNVDDLSKIVQMRVLFNCDDTETANTLTKNYFWKAFTANDLVPVAKLTQTALDNRTTVINRNQLDPNNPDRPRFHVGDIRRPADDPDLPPNRRPIDGRVDPTDPNPNVDIPARSQTGTGDSQWSELLWKRVDMQRVGTANRGWANVTGFRFEITSTTAAAAAVVKVGTLTMFGGANPDSDGLGSPYLYRYRYRASTTGSISNWAPPLFEGIQAYRTNITLSNFAASNQPEVDKFDIERWGGALTNWAFVGSISSGSSTFTDTLSDESIISTIPLLEGDTNYQLWPVRDKPFSTTATVVGTSITTVATLPTQLAKGTPIRIGGVDTTYRRAISVANKIYEVQDCLGSLPAGTALEIPEPLLIGIPLPTLWAWNGRGFACGDTRNPGVLYYTNGNSLDTTQDTFWLEVTSPSEPLINGLSFNGKNYVWSSERMFEIDQIGPNDFVATELPGHKGLFSQWALVKGERIWFLSRDGIYQTGGGEGICITDETLKPLFNKEGNAGVVVNGFQPPDFTVPTKLRLAYYDGYLYFTYQDIAGHLRTLVYTTKSDKPGWWPDVYLDGSGITTLYGVEGAGQHSLLALGKDTTTGKVYNVSGLTDNGAPIPCHVRTQFFDAGDKRADKRWGDLILDANPSADTLNLVVYTNSVTTSQLTVAPTSMVGAARTQQIIDISSGGDPTTDFSRNIALDLSWNSSNTAQLFLWEPSFAARPETTALRATMWDDAGYPGDKFFQGIELQADTRNAARTVQVEYDGLSTNVADTLVVQHNGNIQKTYPFHPAFIAHTVRLHPTDSNTWNEYLYKWIWSPEPPLADRWETQQTSFGQDSFVHMKAMYVTLRSTSIVTMTITRTDDGHVDTYAIPSTASTRLKQYFTLNPTKGKAFLFTFTSASPFRLYKQDTNLLVKPWASEDSFVSRTPFGAVHGDGRAEV